MACFAKLDLNNTVEMVIVIDDKVSPDTSHESEQAGIYFISNVLNLDGIWKQTCPNTYRDIVPIFNDEIPPKIISFQDNGSKHYLNGVPFRNKYAAIGDIYDEESDIFFTP